METLTARQNEVLGFIRRYIAEHGLPPARADIAAHFSISRMSAQEMVQVLARKGHLELLPDSARGIRLIEKKRSSANDPYQLPLIGRVAAGAPVLALEAVDDWLRVDPELFSPRPHYLRRVHGDSMIDMGIFDRDLIAVRSQPVADNGQVVVARLFRHGEPEITVKKYRRRGNRVELLPRNPAMEPIVVDLAEEDFEIEGLYCGHIHRA